MYKDLANFNFLNNLLVSHENVGEHFLKSINKTRLNFAKIIFYFF